MTVVFVRELGLVLQVPLALAYLPQPAIAWRRLPPSPLLRRVGGLRLLLCLLQSLRLSFLLLLLLFVLVLLAHDFLFLLVLRFLQLLRFFRFFYLSLFLLLFYLLS